MPERHRAARACGLVGFAATGDGPVIGRTVELTALRKDGIEIPVEISFAAVRVEYGGIKNLEVDVTYSWSARTIWGVDGGARGFVARPQAIADAVAYLASPQASYITGQTLVVDGGITINGDA